MKKRQKNNAYKRRAWTLLICALLSFVPLPSGITPASLGTTAYAASYSQGYKKYSKGDYDGAIKSLGSALRSVRNAGEKSKIYKLIGICQYMKGQKSSAASSFKAALKINPRITINKSEVLTTSVITFFNSQKGRKSSASAKPAARRAAPTRKSAPTATSTKTSMYGTKGNTTYLTVNSNVSGATVLIDGILAGSTGTRLEVDSGSASVEVKSKGYITAKRTVNITKNQQNTVAINISKPKPKPKPKPRPKAVARSRSNAPSKKANRKSRLFSADEEEEEFASAPPVGRRSYNVPAPAPPQGYAPPPSLPQAPVYAAPPPQVQAYGQPAYPQQAPVYQQPAPVYPQQVPQGYAQPPIYQQPQPYGYAQPQPYLAQPTAPIAPNPYELPPPALDIPSAALPGGDPLLPSPMESPSTGFQDQGPAVGDIDSFRPPSDRAPTVKRRKRRSLPPLPARGTNSSRKKSRSSRSNEGGSSGGQIFAALLPFGIGQFYNGSYGLGAGLLVGEAAAIGGYLYFSSLQTAKTEEANKFGAELESNRELKDQYSAEDIENYENGVNAFNDEQRQYGLYSLIAFGGLWAIGTVEALLNAPSGKKKKKKRGRRRYSLDKQNNTEVKVANQSIINETLRPFENTYQFSLLNPLSEKLKSNKDDADKYGISIDYRF